MCDTFRGLGFRFGIQVLDSGLGLKLGIHVWSSSYEIQVEESGFVFQFGILVSESGLGCRVWDSGLRFIV